MNRSLLGALLAALCYTSPACTGIEPELRSLVEQTGAQTEQGWHSGPPVEIAETGTARFAKTLYDGFRPHRALELVTFIDRFYRAPANRGFDEVLARVDKALREIGFDGQDQRLQVSYIKVADLENAWTPVSGKLVLKVEGEEPRVLHSFSKSEDVDRVMLPINAPSCRIEAEVALRLDDVKKGMLLVTNVDASQVKSRARHKGAVGVISASLRPFNEDRTGAGRHLDAIQFRRQEDDMPAAQISPRSLEVIEAAVERAEKRGVKVKLELQAEVLTEKRPLRTLMAVIKGAKRPGEAVAMVSHVQEPGACDNATGVAGLAESVRALVEALRAKTLPWPDRSLVFLWGDEFRQSESWLDTTDMKPVVGISSDMTGQSKEATGADPYLERNYDPGAIKVLPPDFHTPWGAGQVSKDEIRPNGLALIARCAMADVSRLEGGKWKTFEHPFEGGSDHDKFLQRGIPAVLFWHFTDFTYHTSLDRMQYVDGDEMRRTGVALLTTGLAVASPEPGDLDRYINSLEKERLLRIQQCEEHNDIDLAEMWDAWSDGTREWLRNQCLGIDEKIPKK